MLPRKYKLTLDKDFDKTFKTGRSLYGRFLGFKMKKNNLEHSRFGVILGLKVDKSAVGRHRLKRQIFSIIENNAQKLSFPADCVIIALPAVKDASYQEIEKEIIDLLSQLSK